MLRHQRHPKTDNVKSDSGYSRRIDWVLKSNFVTVKSEFFDDSGELLKTAAFSDIQQIDPKANKWQAMRLEAKNSQTGHSTVIQFDSFQVNQNVDEKRFTTRYLEKQ
ncbi:MAG: outer membrane lipoprotein-sorting protein [Limnobacter sp.]|nr:outer membrane lipoprotein-sorting protein [Limnobacter sp.]